jgi:hypothetical protein
MENKMSWTIVKNQVGSCLVKIEENGETKVIPFAEDNTDYQEYLEQLEADK